MKLFGAIAVNVAGEAVLVRAGLLDRIRIWFGGKLRDSGKVRASIQAAAVLDGARDALRTIGVDNAVALIVDDVTLFHDKQGRPDDLGDMFLSFTEHEAALGEGFELIRLTVEHEEAGLHMVLELQARSIHPATEPAMRVVVSGRRTDLEPRAGESSDDYRARVEPLTKDATAVEVVRVQFEAFVSRVRDALQKAMPEAAVDVVTAQARVERPTPPGQEPAVNNNATNDPTSRNYDPYVQYYPSPMSTMLNVMMWSSIFSMMHTPNVVVVNSSNVPTGHATDPGIEQQDPASSEYAESPQDASGDLTSDGSEAGGDFGGGEASGGDFGGGDFGGGDFGGDFGGFE